MERFGLIFSIKNVSDHVECVQVVAIVLSLIECSFFSNHFFVSFLSSSHSHNQFLSSSLSPYSSSLSSFTFT